VSSTWLPEELREKAEALYRSEWVGEG